MQSNLILFDFSPSTWYTLILGGREFCLFLLLCKVNGHGPTGAIRGWLILLPCLVFPSLHGLSFGNDSVRASVRIGQTSNSTKHAMRTSDLKRFDWAHMSPMWAASSLTLSSRIAPRTPFLLRVALLWSRWSCHHQDRGAPRPRARRLVAHPCVARAPSLTFPHATAPSMHPPLSLRPNSMHTTGDEDGDGGSNEVDCEGIWIWGFLFLI